MQVVPTELTLQGSVDITFPMSGAIIYAETIILQGMASEVPGDGFDIQLITPDDSIVAEASIQPEDDGRWFVEIVHEYTGDPTEVTIVAKATDSDLALDYDIVSILLTARDNRPQGIFGSILSPSDGTSVGGDFIPVSGRGSGFFEGTFILRLENSDGDIITEMPVMINNPNLIDDMLWEAELPRNDFIGNGKIVMIDEDEESGEDIVIDNVDVVVSAVAG